MLGTDALAIIPYLSERPLNEPSSEDNLFLHGTGRSLSGESAHPVWLYISKISPFKNLQVNRSVICVSCSIIVFVSSFT
jgi:hypothetical protein